MVSHKEVFVRKSVIFNIIITLILIMVSVTPLLYRTLPEILILLISLLWIFSCFINNKISFNFTTSSFLFWWLAFFIWQLLMTIINHSEVSHNLIIMRIPTFSIPLILSVIIKSYNKAELKRLFLGVSCILLINILSNIYIGYTNPEIFAYLNLMDERDAGFHTNAGSTSFVALCVFIIPSLLIFYQYLISKKYSLIIVAIILLILWYIIVINSRGTAFFMLIILFIGYFLVNKLAHTQRSKWYNIKIIIIMLAAFCVLLIPILTYLADTFSEIEGMAGRMTARFNDIIILLQGRGNIDALDGGSLSNRLLLWLASITTFTSNIGNFIFGIGEDIHEYDLYSLIQSGVGGHSELFDCAAEYGLIGCMFMIMIIKKTFGFIKSITSNITLKKQISLFEMVFILYSFLNNSLITEILSGVLIFFPIVIRLADYHLSIKNNRYVTKTTI